jgi:tungstate transport system ATP-binding protein
MQLKLAVHEVTKTYGKKKLLQGCTQGFGRGVTAIMGPNGCGKSTLLRIGALLETPTSGKVRYYYSRESTAAHNIKLMRKISLVLPRAGIFNASVWRNTTYGLRVRGVGRRKRKKRAEEILKAVGLYEKRKQNALTISTGEAQRLALARAMVLKPEVLFLDEPTGSLDEENTVIVEKIILRLKANPNPPIIVMTTHDRYQAQRLADTTITIRNGKIATASLLGPEDTTETLKKSPGKETDVYINPDFFA